MKKYIWTFIVIVIITISAIRIFQIFFTVGIYYDYAIWCKAKDAQYIESISGIDAKYNIVVCKGNFRRDKFQSSVIKKFPTVFEEKTEIDDGNNIVCEYVHENTNNKEVILICSTPYFIVSLLAIVIFYKKILPKYSDENKIEK